MIHPTIAVALLGNIPSRPHFAKAANPYGFAYVLSKPYTARQSSHTPTGHAKDYNILREKRCSTG